MRRISTALLLAAALGCGRAGPQAQVDAGRAKANADAAKLNAEDAEVAAELARLPPADRELAEAQEWCAVSTDSRLGAMGPPLKVDLGGRPAFVCCEGCVGRAQADPAKTLARVEGLKAKKAAR